MEIARILEAFFQLQAKSFLNFFFLGKKGLFT